MADMRDVTADEFSEFIDHESTTPLQSITGRDLLYIAVGFVATCAPSLTLWMLS